MSFYGFSPGVIVLTLGSNILNVSTLATSPASPTLFGMLSFGPTIGVGSLSPMILVGGNVAPADTIGGLDKAFDDASLVGVGVAPGPFSTASERSFAHVARSVVAHPPNGKSHPPPCSKTSLVVVCG